MLKDNVIENYDTLNDTDMLIWKFIQENKSAVQDMTITELANRTNVSRTTITRFVKKIGLKGYSELKVRLSIENNRNENNGELNYINLCNSLQEYIEKLKELSFEEECKLIEESNRIFIYGTGDIQNAVGKQLQRMFLSEKKLVYLLDGLTLDTKIYEMFESDDLLIIISLSGQNFEALNLAKQAGLRSASIISITEFKHNPLNTLSDESIYIYSPEIDLHGEMMNYQITTLYFVLAELFFVRYSIYKNPKFQV